MKKVYSDNAFHKIEFVPTEVMAKRIGSPALAFVSEAEVSRSGLEASFTMVTGRPASSILKVHKGLVDATGHPVEVMAPFSASLA
mgnify:CR=1 FL=1